MARTKSLPLDSRLLPGFAPRDDNGRGIFSCLADGSIELYELLVYNRKELRDDDAARQEKRELDKIIASIAKNDSTINMDELVFNCNRTSFRAFARFCALERARSSIKPAIDPDTQETTYQSPYAEPPSPFSPQLTPLVAATRILAPVTVLAPALVLAPAPVFAPATMPTSVSKSSPTRKSTRNMGKEVNYSGCF